MALRRDDGRINLALLTRRYDPASEQLLEAMGTASRARAALIDRTIVTLKQSGVWAALDAFWMLAAHDAAASLINWKTPGTFNLTATNSPVFVADRGYTGDGATSCLTGPNLSSFGGMYALNDAHMGCWVGTNLIDNQADMGSANSFIRARALTDTMTTRANEATTVNNVGIGSTSIGHSMWNRTASGAYDVYRNNGTAFPQTTATTAIANASMLVCAAAASFSNHQLAAAHVGKQLTAAQRAGVYSALLTYMGAVGVATA